MVFWTCLARLWDDERESRWLRLALRRCRYLAGGMRRGSMVFWTRLVRFGKGLPLTERRGLSEFWVVMTGTWRLPVDRLRGEGGSVTLFGHFVGLALTAEFVKDGCVCLQLL